MIAKKLLVAALFCSAFATLPAMANAAAAPEGKTRAEVLAELKQAKADGSYYCIDSDLQYECANRAAVKQITVKRAPQIGRWLTQSGQLEIDISTCGQALCGTVVKMASENGTASAVGLKVLSELTAVSETEWKGRIYNRGDGMTYDCLVSLASANELRVVAYKDTPANGRELRWSRVDAVSLSAANNR